MSDETENKLKDQGCVVGFVFWACQGIALVGVVFAGLHMSNQKDATGAGVCLLASALSMGLLANAVLRR